MKKFFTLLLLLGVVLCGWADPYSWDSSTGTLTVTYEDGLSGSQVRDQLNNYQGQVRKLVLVGNFSNQDFNDLDGGIEKCAHSDGIILDLTGCTGMVSKVLPECGEYSADIDWVRTNAKFYPDGQTQVSEEVKNPLRKVENTVNVTSFLWVHSEYSPVVNNPDTTKEYDWEGHKIKYENGNWVVYWSYGGSQDVHSSTSYTYTDENGESQSQTDLNNPNKLTDNGDGTYSYICYIYSDNNGTTQKNYPSEIQNDSNIQPDGNGGYVYTYTRTYTPSAFKLGNFKGNVKLKGLYFPSNENFTAIPNELCQNLTNLAEIKLGDHVEYIGTKAFAGCTSLGTVGDEAGIAKFPNALKVIGGDAFYKCQEITKVDLDLPNLQKIDYAAFNMVDENNKLTEVVLPTSTNNSLEFFGNQVFSSSKVEELDFSNCLLITNFAYDGNNVFNEQGYTGETTTSNQTFTWYSSLKKIIFPPNLVYLGESAFNHSTALETAIFTGKPVYEDCELKNGLYIDNSAFKDIEALTSVTLTDNVDHIGDFAFQKTNLTEIVIPGHVTYIGTQAFANNYSMTKVVFKDLPEEAKNSPCENKVTMEIKTEAFVQNENITDVYIDALDANFSCEAHAFDYITTVGQTQADHDKATLHYPAAEKDKYVTSKHTLDYATMADPGAFQAWLSAHLNYSKDPHMTPTGSENGFFEFVEAGPIDENELIIPGGKFLYTFSDHQNSHMVPGGVKAYLVNSISGLDANNNFTVKLTSVRVIPKMTGVILYGNTNSETESGDPTLVLPVVEYTGNPLDRANWSDLEARTVESFTEDEQGNVTTITVEVKEHPELKNFLLPTSDAEGNELTLHPYEPYPLNGGTVTERNFGLARISSTISGKKYKEANGSIESDYASFFRLLPGSFPIGKAYLHFLADEYTLPEGGEAIVEKDDHFDWEFFGSTTAKQDTGHKYWPADRAWNDDTTYDWGDRTKLDQTNIEKYFVKFLEEGMFDEDGVISVTIPASALADEYYTLQGLKVSNPTKGVYIKNGKKVVLK